MGFFGAMFCHCFFFFYGGALQAEVIRGQAADRSAVGLFAHLGHEGHIVEYGPQDGLVMLNTCVGCLLTLVQKTLYMLCKMC